MSKAGLVAQEEALSYVAGYFIMNDVSARDIQFVDKQYSQAKGFDTFGPVVHGLLHQMRFLIRAICSLLQRLTVKSDKTHLLRTSLEG